MSRFGATPGAMFRPKPARYRGWWQLRAISRSTVCGRAKPQGDDLDAAAEKPDDAPSPEARTVASDENRRLADCLAKLDDAHSEAVRRAFMEGYTYEELAAHMDVPLGTMKSWIRRSLLKLRDCLKR